MPSLSTFTNVETAIITALAAAATPITCYGYEDDYMDAIPCATLVLRSVDSGYLDLDQAYGAGQAEWYLRYYVSLEQPRHLAFEEMKTGLATIYEALGTDRTIGGACRDHALSDFDLDNIVQVGDRLEWMAEAKLLVTLHPNIGTST